MDISCLQVIGALLSTKGGRSRGAKAFSKAEAEQERAANKAAVGLEEAIEVKEPIGPESCHKPTRMVESVLF